MLSLKTGKLKLRMWKSLAKATSVGREAKIRAHSAADRLRPSRTNAASLLWGSVGRASQTPCSRVAGAWQSQEALPECWRQAWWRAFLTVPHQPPACLLSSIPSSRAYTFLRTRSSLPIVVAHLHRDSSEEGRPSDRAAPCLPATSLMGF